MRRGIRLRFAATEEVVMRGLRWLVVLCLGSAFAALAQDAPAAALPPPSETPPRAVAPESAAALTPAVNVAAGTWVGVHAAVHIGLVGLDLHVNRSYTFLAGSLGIPLVANGAFGAFAIGSGYSFHVSAPGESMWVLDVFGLVNPGWQQRSDFNTCNQFVCVPANVPFVGIGVGAGFRFLHWSGFTFGFKLPVFGAAINGGRTTAEAVGTFYLANFVGLPILSFGIRW
jgi:hypothetical protein